MKTLQKIILGISIATYAFASFALPKTPTIEIIVNEAPDNVGPPNKGMRTPSSPKECTIDFDNHRIELPTSEFISAYELWDVDGTYVIASYASEPEFVDFLYELTGEYQLRLNGEDHVYIGYLEL